MADNANILLVDDESRNLDVLEALLQSPEYHLVRAQTADQALLLLLEQEFAVIVLDINMPRISGIELANLVKQRKRTQHIPIIFLTAYYQEDKDILKGYVSGAVDYLTKPINPDILRSKIGVFVDLFHKSRALAASNAALESEIAFRQEAEMALREANNELEARVAARTTELNRLNDELRAREAALAASEAQAQAASRAKDDFLAALSHELRTPLNPVLLLATEAASNAKLAPEVRADFDIIAKNVALEARLIDDLLDLTRITHGKLTLDLQPCDIHTCLRDALEMTTADAQAKKLAVDVALNARRSMVRGDDVRLKQIFWNVVKNAVKFTPSGGHITVTTSINDAEEIVIQVTDTGIGMTPTEVKRVFAAFSQGDHALQRTPHRFGGLGLGLAISQMMAKLQLGTISAFSSGRDQGTTLVIKFPLLAAESQTSAKLPSGKPTPSPFAEGSPGGQLRVLLVEDHPSTAQTLALLLQRRKFAVTVANCLGEARLFALKERFSLLISDIGLPDGNGYELMAELRDSQGILGIALTGYGSESDIQRSLDAGFFTQLTKPVSVQSLDGALAEAVRRLKANSSQLKT